MSKRRRKRSALRQNFTKFMQKKLVMVYMFILLAFLVLVLRITQINITKGDEYAKIVLDQQQYGSNVIPFRRGDILDAKGTVLATSERVYTIIIDVKGLLDQVDENNSNVSYVNDTRTAIVEFFAETEEERAELESKFNEQIEKYPTKHYRKLLEGVTYAQLQKFLDRKNETEEYVEINSKGEAETKTKNKYHIYGISYENTYNRKYPNGTLACDVIGFTSNGNVGSCGLEAYYNEELNGTDGRIYGYQDMDSNTKQSVKEAVDGNTIVTTIDANLQAIVEKHLARFLKSYTNVGQEGPGFQNGAVLIMDPNTGAILAQACSPVYDLNNPGNVMDYYSEEDIELQVGKDLVFEYNTEDAQKLKARTLANEMKESESEVEQETFKNLVNAKKVELQNGLWTNFAVNNTYEPGSTVKPLTVAAGLETGAIDGSEMYTCNGYKKVLGWEIQCSSYDEGGHGRLNLTGAIENSCNVALMDIGEKIGAEELLKYQRLWGFGQLTGIDLSGEQSASALVYNEETMKESEIATSSFGQGYNVTMVQLASAFSSLINGGNLYQPYVVKEIRDANGNVLKATTPTLKKKTVSAETGERVKRMMVSVVENGTGKKAAVRNYEIGGKTGTAEKVPRGYGNYLVSFIGYAPQENPEVVVYVVIDEPNVRDQSSSSGVICKLASEIMADAFPYMNITTIKGAKEKAEAEKKAAEEAMLAQQNEEANGEPKDAPDDDVRVTAKR